MNSRTKRILTVTLLAATVIALWLFLRPCGIVPETQSDTTHSEISPQLQLKGAKKAIAVRPEEKHGVAENNVPPAKEEVDHAPPVQISNTDQIPNVAKCVTRNFPADAKPHVKAAVVTVRLVVDKFGNVRSDTPISVEFPADVDEDVVPAMRKLFIQAGSHAFGAKKCPPHVVNGQNVGYAIEVPLQYKH